MDMSAEQKVEAAFRRLEQDELFRRLPLEKFRHEFGEDANGQRALWVFVIVPDTVQLGLSGGPRLDVRLSIRKALLDEGCTERVYTRFRRVSEERETDAKAASA